MVVSCQVLQQLGFRMTRSMVGKVISSFLSDLEWPSPFTDGIPGKDWWNRFLRRWPSLSEHKPQHLSKKKEQMQGTLNSHAKLVQIGRRIPREKGYWA